MLKVMVLGFDGASPKLINEWIKDLPTLKTFNEQGIFGRNIPPIPAQTPVAWTTLMTGKNPGKHGIFSFATRRPSTYERRIINPALIKSKTLWRTLSEHRKRVGVINVPMAAYEEINGFMIPGFLSKREGMPNPPKVREKLNQKFGIQRIAGDVETELLEKVKSDPDTFFKRINEITDEQAEVSLYLLEQEKWDFFITVFMGTDRIQHFFWKNIDESHAEYEENQYTEKAKQHYKKIDRIIDRFLEAAPKNTITILLSDHGFCPIQKEVLINNYLQELGMLKARKGKIDMEQSRAISYGYGDIWLNVKDREPKGIIKQGEEYEETREVIIEALENLKIDQQNPIKKVKKREEIYWGPHLNEAPDLTILFNPGWQAARRLEIQTEKRPNKRYIIDNPRWSGGHDGTHDPTDVPGILAILGPRIRAGKEIQAHLWDIAPTVLNQMKVPIPREMDGKPLLITPQKDLSIPKPYTSGFRRNRLPQHHQIHHLPYYQN